MKSYNMWDGTYRNNIIILNTNQADVDEKKNIGIIWKESINVWKKTRRDQGQGKSKV